jgi:hypothetical protein
MALTPPSAAIYPKSRIKRIIQILYDGTQPGHLEFSIAELELHNGEKVRGIRYDRSTWSNNPENGYPLVRGGRPSWFILPNDLKKVLDGLS